ncbi:hypothetical protein [Caballeronia humi]|uniref:Uncharacterized protein n=1 Tax=Caballeronia humi TaxID=326474 RepID=A0A158I1R3_9BURK|nr:hypothetical protein [Caballeronia humi]SAL50486.1 hypothetical protein AWB65_04094 [Caballeronia humi]
MNPIIIACMMTACSLAPSLSVAQKPFEFRGLPLGISLDDFRRHQAARATPEGSVAICETDPEAAALGMSLRNAESLSIACKWAHRGDGGWQASQAVVDGAPARDHILRFLAMPGEASPRLYRMSFVVDARVLGDFAEALASKYGRSRVENLHGESRRIWDNATSSITIETSAAASNGRVIYRLADHEAYLRTVMNAWRSATASLNAP